MSFLDKKSADDVEDDDFNEETEYEIAKNNCNVSAGDRWTLGDHILMCGDSTKIGDVRNLMGGGYGRSLCNRPSIQHCL